MFNGHFYPLVRLAARRELRSQGKSLRETRELLDAATDDLIDTATAAVEAAAQVPGEFRLGAGKLGAIGDGSIIKAIMDFLASPTGQAIIAMLLKLLLGGL